MNKDVLSKLKSVGLLSDQPADIGFVPTGSFALNKVISGSYTKGIPIGMITQFHGEASTAKTVFLTHILREAQALNYHTMLIDSENAFNSTFSQSLGLDPTKLIYATPETLEDCFQVMHDTILAIRESDPNTPIIIGYDSIAVSPTRAELESENYENNNMEGAVRAKLTGSALRSLNTILRKYKVGLVIINQIRNKVGVMYGDPTTTAAGGKSLDYYLGVNLRCVSNKTSDLLKDDNGNAIGIKGDIVNKKNKVSLPFRECEFELLYDKGLNKFAGLSKFLEQDGLLSRAGAWYTVVGTDRKFQSKDFEKLILDPASEGFAPIKTILGLQ